MQAAKDVEADHAATQDAINGAWSDLLDAIHLLGFAEGDTTELEELLAIAGMLDEAGYTPSSWSVLQEAMDAAQEVLADEEPLQADVEEAYDALYDALTNLDLVADTSKLQAVVNQAESIDLADYLEDGQDAFLEALDAAKDVLENLDATQAEVDEAAETLNRAMQPCGKSRSREELQKLIDETEQIDLDEYTDRSAGKPASSPARRKGGRCRRQREQGRACLRIQRGADGTGRSCEGRKPAAAEGFQRFHLGECVQRIRRGGRLRRDSCTERRYTGERAQRHDRGLHPAARPGILL